MIGLLLIVSTVAKVLTLPKTWLCKMILLLKDLTSNSRDGACGSTLVLAKDKNAKRLYYLTSNDTDETDVFKVFFLRTVWMFTNSHRT